jgi:hypothetical protein
MILNQPLRTSTALRNTSKLRLLPLSNQRSPVSLPRQMANHVLPVYNIARLRESFLCVIGASARL